LSKNKHLKLIKK